MPRSANSSAMARNSAGQVATKSLTVVHGRTDSTIAESASSATDVRLGSFQDTRVFRQEITHDGERRLEISSVSDAQRKIMLPQLAIIMQDLSDDLPVWDDHARKIGVHQPHGE
jgi:hypothetical protein